MRDWQLVKLARATKLPRISRAMRFGIVAAVVLTAAGAWVLYGSSAFAVTEVLVKGATFVETEQIRQAAGVPKGTALAAVDTDEVAARVQGVAPVAGATVSRDWPHTLVVEITERTPYLAVPGEAGVGLVDSSGVAYRTVDEIPPGIWPVELKTPGPQDPATLGVLSVLSSLTEELRAELQTISAPAPTRIELRLKGGRTIFWGDATDSAEKSAVATVLLARSADHLDVSAPGVPTVRD